MNKVQTSYVEIRKFARQLQVFTDEIDNQMKKIVSETDAVTAYSWKGRQADEFKDVINESKEEMNKQINYLNSLIVEIEKKADALEATVSSSMKK